MVGCYGSDVALWFLLIRMLSFCYNLWKDNLCIHYKKLRIVVLHITVHFLIPFNASFHFWLLTSDSLPPVWWSAELATVVTGPAPTWFRCMQVTWKMQCIMQGKQERKCIIECFSAARHRNDPDVQCKVKLFWIFVTVVIWLCVHDISDWDDLRNKILK